MESNVPIGPGERLNSESDLGDIDILAIDKERRNLFSIECKNVNYARSPREMENEKERFMGNGSEDKSWIDRHRERDQWLRDNLQVLTNLYGLPTAPSIHSVILTSEEIPTTFVSKNVPMPVLSFTQLKRKGVSALHASESQEVT